MQNKYIHNDKSILEQFLIFYKNNKFQNMQQAVEFFAVFGGLCKEINTQNALEFEIKENILKRYKYLRNDISDITGADETSHKILSALAQGDRRTNSAFKKCKMSFDNGIEIIDDLCDRGTIKLEKSLFRLTNKPKDDDISEKLIFSSPFIHFWFAFVSPVFKGVRDGKFSESLTLFENRKTQFISFVFEQLCFELLKELFKDDKIQIIGRYWDNTSNVIDILAQTTSKKIIAGSIKYTNSKVKKSTLSQLHQSCYTLGVSPDIYIIFSKSGFSSELKSIKGDNLRLCTIKHLSRLI